MHYFLYKYITKPTLFLQVIFACYVMDLIASGKNLTISDAIMLSCPSFSAAKSPLLPWRYTATAAAISSLIPLAASAATIPASTSPLPPVARPGLPVLLIYCVPSDAVTIVWCPFNINVTPLSWQDWLIVIGGTSIVLWIGEIGRLINRLKRK